jgi:hypothetical protein
MSSAVAEIYEPFKAAKPVRIVAVEADAPPVLRVTFDDGATRAVDLSETIARSRWFHTLATPTTFADVEIIHDGRALQWVSGADYCADALRVLADRQRAEAV